MNIRDNKFLLSGLLGLLTLTSFSFAFEAPELITDRPDQTESSATVPTGYAQIEMGWQHLEEERADLETDILPQTLLRYGLVENLEFRLGFDGYTWEKCRRARSGRRRCRRRRRP